MSDSLRLLCEHQTDHVVAASLAQRFARELGFDDRSASAVAIVVGELVSNAVRHAGSGTLDIKVLRTPSPGIEVSVRDSGPGIHQATLSGPHDLHGLAAVMRLVDEIDIDTKSGGTVVIARHYLKPSR